MNDAAAHSHSTDNATEDASTSQLPLDGIHHITATTGDARANVEFYTGVLGLRLNAKSVNQDDPVHYHLFYGDELAHPGSDLTFFEYRGARRGRAGAGMVHRVVWRVGSPAALDFWRDRLAAKDVRHEQLDDGSLLLSDPEGLDHQLVVAIGEAAGDPPLRAVHPEIPAEHALLGFDGVRAYSHATPASERILVDLLGATRRTGTTNAANGNGTADDALELRHGRRGGWIAFDEAPPGPGIQGAGAVHHIAFATRDEDQDAWLDLLDGAGIRSSGHVDRHYFRSLYFREPGGILYELATDGPGFTVDGPVAELGERIILPPFLEPHRAVIEPNLTKLPNVRADWPDAALQRARTIHDAADEHGRGAT